MHTRIVLGSLLLAVAMTFEARAGDPADEIRELRRQIEQQAAELERLRAALQRLESTVGAAQTSARTVESVTKPTAPSSFKFNGLFQGWAATGDRGFQDTFRIRRAEMKFSGEIAHNVGWTLMVDPAKTLSLTSTSGQTAISQSGRLLQDAYLSIGAPAHLQLTAGQTKIPISREGLESSAALAIIERPLFMTDRSRAGAYGDVRDIGVALRRTVADRYDVVVGLFNGTGESQNDVDRNERKAVIGRLTAPVGAIRGLRLGGSAAWGGGGGADRRDRVGADVLLERGRWNFKSEVMAGRDGPIDRLGLYGHVGARINPRLELVARVDQWDPDASSDRDLATSLERDYILGGTMTLVSTLRMQANLIHKTFASDAVPERNLVLINLQTSW